MTRPEETTTAILAFLALFFAAAADAAPRTYTISPDGKNAASFRIDDAIERIDGTTTKVSGSVVADAENAAASTVNLRVELASLDTGISLRNQHVRERFLETSKYPYARFKSVGVKAPSTAIAPNNPADIDVTGDFTMHGVTRRITVPVRVVVIPESDLTKSTRGPGDWIHATATFSVRLADYDVHVPDTFLVNTADPIPVRIDVFANAR
jgi:polyisoprenoid-binding protein YceI